MAQEVKKVEFNGKSQTIAEWSKETGISKEAIRHRLARGHSVEDTLTKSFVKPVSKNDAEWMLDDTERTKLPAELTKLFAKKECKGKRYGFFFRTYFRKEFDIWYEKNFNLEGTRDVACFKDKTRKVYA